MSIHTSIHGKLKIETKMSTNEYNPVPYPIITFIDPEGNNIDLFPKGIENVELLLEELRNLIKTGKEEVKKHYAERNERTGEQA